MLIPFNPAEYETKTEYHTCLFHEKNPGVPYAGCTCSSTHTLVKKEFDRLLDSILERHKGAWGKLGKM